MPENHHEGGTSVDSQQARVGQRVARDRLHQRTGHPQGSTDHKTDQRPRQTQLANHKMVVGAVEVGERPNHRAERNLLEPMASESNRTTTRRPTQIARPRARVDRRRRTGSVDELGCGGANVGGRTWGDETALDIGDVRES